MSHSTPNTSRRRGPPAGAPAAPSSTPPAIEAITQTTAALVTQLTCREVLGLKRERYLALLKVHRIPAWHAGKSVLSEVQEWLRVFRERAAAELSADADSVDAVLAELGYRRRSR